MKRCPCCKQEKPTIEFHKSKRHNNGISPRCISCGIAYAQEWYRNNKDRKRAYDAKRRSEQRHLYRAASERWRRKHPGKKNADTQLRRAALHGAFPQWADRFAIKRIYDEAAKKTQSTGIRWVVDHVIPIRGKHVCGLHVAGNLRIVEERENLTKSNHFSIADGGIR